ncbi:LysR family transcriptional regulator [Enterococcus faecalis]
MSIEKLEYFFMIAKYNSISKASKELYVSISSLSLALKSLENELGYSLFIRNGKRMHLSEAGKQILPYVKQIIEDAKKIKIPLYDTIACPSVKVGISESSLIFEVNEHHMQNHKFNINYVNAPALELLQQLKKQQLDLVITSNLIDDPSFIRTSLVELQPMLAINKTMLEDEAQEIAALHLERLPFIILTDHLSHQLLTQKIVADLSIKPTFLYCHDSLGLNKWLYEKRGVFVISSIEKDFLWTNAIQFIELPSSLSLKYYLYKNVNSNCLVEIEDVEKYLKQIFVDVGTRAAHEQIKIDSE